MPELTALDIGQWISVFLSISGSAFGAYCNWRRIHQK